VADEIAEPLISADRGPYVAASISALAGIGILLGSSRQAEGTAGGNCDIRYWL